MAGSEPVEVSNGHTKEDDQPKEITEKHAGHHMKNQDLSVHFPCHHPRKCRLEPRNWFQVLKLAAEGFVGQAVAKMCSLQHRSCNQTSTKDVVGEIRVPFKRGSRLAPKNVMDRKGCLLLACALFITCMNFVV